MFVFYLCHKSLKRLAEAWAHCVKCATALSWHQPPAVFYDRAKLRPCVEVLCLHRSPHLLTYHVWRKLVQVFLPQLLLL